jgi:hypothetical protein
VPTNSVFQRFIRALKRHWKTAPPAVTPLRVRVGPLSMASSFDAGTIADTRQHVYLQFQTTSKEAGYFTINLIVADEGQPVSDVTLFSGGREADKRFGHGAHRIGSFVGNKRHDKWWHLCDVDEESLAGNREFWRKLRLELRQGNWTAASYANEQAVIDAAVADVTRDVETAPAGDRDRLGPPVRRKVWLGRDENLTNRLAIDRREVSEFFAGLLAGQHVP